MSVDASSVPAKEEFSARLGAVASRSPVPVLGLGGVDAESSRDISGTRGYDSDAVSVSRSGDSSQGLPGVRVVLMLALFPWSLHSWLKREPMPAKQPWALGSKSFGLISVDLRIDQSPAI
jgi:hypothetical protein